MHDLFTRGIGPDGKLRPPREQAPELYQQTPIGWIPKEWRIGLLNDIVNPCRPVVYGILMPGYGFDGGVPVVKVKDIVDRRIDVDNLLLTSPKIDHEYRRSRLQAGDILITIRGSVGRICVVPPELDGANITQDTARISVSNGDANFYSYFLESAAAKRHFDVNTLGQAVQGINLGEVRKTPIVIPNKDEQREIRARIDVILKKREAEKSLLIELKKQKAGLMHDLLTGKVPVNPDPPEPADA
jgi:type I restriction enzyme S subunit